MGLNKNLQNHFSVEGNSLQRKYEIIANLSFYSSVYLVTEALFISEQSAEWKVGALLEISEEF